MHDQNNKDLETQSQELITTEGEAPKEEETQRLCIKPLKTGIKAGLRTSGPIGWGVSG